MSASLEIFARQSLAQFITIYAEVVQGTDSMTPVELQGRMWEKIKGGPSSASSVKLPWNLVKKVKCQLPFLPDCINYTGCQALKKADGLYVPCGGKCDGIMCQSCAKSEAKFGMLEDRGAPGTYTDPSDKHEITYGTWLAKHDKSIEEVYQMLQEEGFSLVIPEAYLAVNAKRVTATRRPGRPGNAKTKHSDSEAEESETEPEKVVKEPKEKVVKEPKEKKEKATKKKTESGSDEEITVNTKSFPTQTQAMAEAARMMAEFDPDEEGEVVVTKVATKPEKKSGSDSEKETPKEKKAEKKEKSGSGSDSEKETPKEKKAEKKEKSGSGSDSEKEKPKEKKAEKKEKAEKPKEKRAEKPEKKAEKPKDKKAEKPKKEETKTKPVETVEDGEIVEEEYEPEDEDITYEGESYILRDGKIVFNQDGEILGSMEDGKITFE